MPIQQFPSPDKNALAHSEKVKDYLRTEINKKGPISFARFMEIVLYAPALGYYSVGTHKFGAEGDFVTAPEISSLFSRCIARQCHQVLEMLGEGDILEFGAGSGIMAMDLLLELETLSTLPKYYYIMEVSADLRARQQQLFQKQIPHLMHHIRWLDFLPTTFKGVVIANEVLDAMPIHRFKQNDPLQEYYVNYEHELNWYLDKAHPDVCRAVSQMQMSLNEGYESEINLQLSSWLASIGEILQQGLCLIIDYGFPRHEFYHPERNCGTLMCHYRHHAHSNPLLFPGIQDVTSHVDFTSVAEAAFAADFEISGYTTQARFLLSCGLMDMAESDNYHQNIEHQWMTSNQIKILTLPTEMGELFKAVALTKKLTTTLCGFQLDMREKL